MAMLPGKETDERWREVLEIKNDLKLIQTVTNFDFVLFNFQQALLCSTVFTKHLFR